MKKRKRILTMLLAAVLATSMVACSGAKEPADESAQTATPETQEATKESEAAGEEPTTSGWVARDFSAYCKTTYSNSWNDEYGAATYGDPINLAEGGHTLGVSISMTTDYFQTVADSFTEMAEKDGNKVITVSAERDASKQIADVEDLITAGCDAIMLCAMDRDAITPALIAMEEAGVYCIAFDAAPAATQYCQGFAGTDNFAAGYEGGVQMLKDYPEGGKVAVLGAPSSSAGLFREEGFLAAIEGSNLEVVANFDSQGDQEMGLNLTNDILEAHSDIVAIWNVNDQSGMGAYASCAAVGAEVGLYAVDGTPEVKSYILEGGNYKMTAGQSPITIGVALYALTDAIVAQADIDYNFTDVAVIVMTPDTVEPYIGDEWS